MICQSLKQHRGIVLILIGFLILGAVYSTANPIFEAPDEIQHYFHVKHIADGKGLPVVRPEGGEIHKQEGGQPSLYYLLGALATFWADTNDAQSLLNSNPYVILGMASPEGNKNVILHTDRESFPYRGTTLAVHVLRCLSLVFGVSTVLTTYLLSLRVLPGQKLVALGAAVLTAFNPKFIFTNASVSNDSLLIALCSLALLAAVCLLKGGPSLGGYIGLGVVVGLAAVTKLTGLGLLALVLFTLILLGVRYTPKEAIRGGAIVFGLVILLAGWWYARNWVLYNDPTGMNVFFAALGEPLGGIPLSRILRELHGFRMSYWAVFGWLNVLAARWVYRFFDLLVVLGIIGLPLAVVRGLRRPRIVSFSSLVLMVLWIAVVALGYVRFNLALSGGTGRLTFPAIACFSILLSWGLTQIPPRRWGTVFVAVLATTMSLIALACPFLYIAPAYARPSPLADQQLQSMPRQTNIEYEGQMRLLGYEVDGDVFSPGEVVRVTLYWEALTGMDRNYSVSLIVLTPDGDLVGQQDSYPGLGNFPTTVWQPGETIADRLWVQIRPGTPTPTIGRLGVSIHHLPTMERLAPHKSGQAVEQVFLEAVKIVPWRVRQYEISHPVHFNLGDQIALIGYDLDTSRPQPGGVIGLTLHWQARQEMDRDYTVFTHVIDGADRIWAQQDNPPLGGNYPTSFWGPGEAIRDRYEIALPPDIPTGDYWLEVGLYLLSTGQRLPVLDDAGQVLDDRTLLETITVSR